MKSIGQVYDGFWHLRFFIIFCEFSSDCYDFLHVKSNEVDLYAV